MEGGKERERWRKVALQWGRYSCRRREQGEDSIGQWGGVPLHDPPFPPPPDSPFSERHGPSPSCLPAPALGHAPSQPFAPHLPAAAPSSCIREALCPGAWSGTLNSLGPPETRSFLHLLPAFPVLLAHIPLPALSHSTTSKGSNCGMKRAPVLPELQVSGIYSTFVDTKGDALKRQEWSGFASTEIASEPTNSFNQPVLFKELAPIARVVLKREVTPLPGSEQTQRDPCCGFQSKARTVLHAGPFSGRHKPHSDHSLPSEKSVSSFAQPCFTSLSQSLLGFP